MNITYHKDGKYNWGDYLPPVLFKHITGIDATYAEYDSTEQSFVTVGSILSLLKNEKSIIWGTGFVSESCKMSIVPEKIHAVRGPLTRQILMSQDIDCPEVYGDPALLLPRFYNPEIEKKYDIGIVAHYVDANNEILLKNENENILVIDICQDTHTFVDQVKSCDKILSSSLHGLITADAYDIPNCWINFSDLIIGNGFKFQDYFLSIQKPIDYAIEINSIDDIYHAASWAFTCVEIDLINLYEVCPFKNIN